MKKAKYIILLSLTILLTGCVKSNTSMTINKDKSMSLTSEVLISDKLLDKESRLIIKDEKDKLQKKNMTVEGLLEKFRSGAGKALDNDRILLSD